MIFVHHCGLFTHIFFFFSAIIFFKTCSLRALRLKINWRHDIFLWFVSDSRIAQLMLAIASPHCWIVKFLFWGWSYSLSFEECEMNQICLLRLTYNLNLQFWDLNTTIYILNLLSFLQALGPLLSLLCCVHFSNPFQMISFYLFDAFIKKVFLFFFWIVIFTRFIAKLAIFLLYCWMAELFIFRWFLTLNLQELEIMKINWFGLVIWNLKPYELSK